MGTNLESTQDRHVREIAEARSSGKRIPIAELPADALMVHDPSPESGSTHNVRIPDL